MGHTIISSYSIQSSVDVFGIRTSAPLSRVQTRETSELQLRVFSLRKRLRSINLDGVARPRSQVDVLSLPNNAHRKALLKQFSDVIDEVAELPLEALDDPVVDTELRSLREEVDAANIFMGIIHHLANVSLSVQSCDNAISDFLEHIDSFPSLPPGPLCSTHESDSSLLPEEQLSARLMFTESQIQHMEAQFALVPDDPRVISERDRVTRTWSELSAMGHDLLNGRKSRPGSVISSGSYSSRSSAGETSASLRKKKASYSALSASTSGGQFLTPPLAQNRRSVSGGPARDHSRSSSRASVISTARSVSGPLNSITSRLYNSTFASRQRTNSTTTPSSPSMSPRSRPILLPTRPRAQTNQRDRTSSPAMSDSSSVSQPRSTMSVSHSSTSRSTWARTPRKSFATLPRVSPPRSRLPMMRKPYIANPKSKLDVAVGDVVNKLPKNVNINVEVVGDTWRDQSGKYWIGSQDPKLCFCRILRSQTVMVRVGGGWSELSKYVEYTYYNQTY